MKLSEGEVQEMLVRKVEGEVLEMPVRKVEERSSVCKCAKRVKESEKWYKVQVLWNRFQTQGWQYQI